MKISPKDYLLGFLSAACLVLLLAASAPSEWGIWDDPDEAPWQRVARLDGQNSALASGTWDLSAVTLHVGSIVVDGTASIKIIQFTPQLTAAEQGVINTAANAGSAYTIQGATEISLGGVNDDGTFQAWQTTAVVSATDPLRFLATAAPVSFRSAIR